MVGRWSDAYGRKRFMMLSLTCSAAQMIALLLYLTRGTSLFFFFPCQVRPPLMVPSEDPLHACLVLIQC